MWGSRSANGETVGGSDSFCILLLLLRLLGGSGGKKKVIKVISCSSCLCHAESCRLLITGDWLKSKQGKVPVAEQPALHATRREAKDLLFGEEGGGVVVFNRERYLCYLGKRTRPLAWVSFRISTKQTEINPGTINLLQST